MSDEFGPSVGDRIRANPTAYLSPIDLASYLALSRSEKWERGHAAMIVRGRWQGSAAQRRWRALNGDAACVECGHGGSITPDHILPIVRGGTNDPSNLRPLCSPCNSRKGLR